MGAIPYKSSVSTESIQIWPGHSGGYDFATILMLSPPFKPLIDFIHTELNLSLDAIAIAFRRPLLSPNQVPVALWNLGLITLEDVGAIFDWLETQTANY